MKGYVPLRRGIVEHLPIFSFAETKVYVYLLCAADYKTGKASVSMESLAEAVGHNEKTVRLAIKRLKVMRYIGVKIAKNQWKDNEFTIKKYNSGLLESGQDQGKEANCSGSMPEPTPEPTPGPTPAAQASEQPKRAPKNYKNIEELKNSVGLVIGRLNEKAGKSFSVKGKQAEFVLARLKEGATIDQCFAVIDRKVQQWQGTTHAIYLRPSTLFNATQFEAYLNEPAVKALGGTDAALKRRADDCYQNDPEQNNPNSCRNSYQNKEVCRHCPKKELVKV